MKLSGTKLVFDIDGVLIDTTRSYRWAIKKTAEYFLNKPISIKDVDRIKMLEGFNNDWYAGYILTNSILLGLGTDKYKDITTGNEKISYEQIKEVFQELYLGADKKDGLKEKEALIFSVSDLKKLTDKFGLLSIITGRTDDEAQYVLRRFKIDRFFSEVISVENTKNFDFVKYPELRKFGQDKSNPVLFYKLKNIRDYKHIYYIGDNISDVQLAQNSKEKLPVKSILLYKAYSVNNLKILKHRVKYSAPDYYCGTKDETIKVLLNLI
ncbi:MAG: HAD hydrolase-like protein [Candidatus Margulisbacteria bacterium]|nr:HAD hydrolase-like protein [Candidatus Margulisiibacteriota bacterium]